MQGPTAIDYKVTQAQAVLASAVKEQHEARHGELVRQLGNVRAQLRMAHRHYQTLTAKIKSDHAERAQIQNKLDMTLFALANNTQKRPAVASYLPDDLEVVTWQRERTQLEVDRDVLIAQRNAINMGSDIVEAAAFEGPNGTIARLDYIESNLLAQLTGTHATGWTGGVSAI